jgi:hypothetical protein
VRTLLYEAANAGTRKRRHPEEGPALDPLENKIRKQRTFRDCKIDLKRAVQKIKVSEIGLFWFATRAERGDSPVTSMFRPSGATVVSIDGPRIAALAQFLL